MFLGKMNNARMKWVTPFLFIYLAIVDALPFWAKTTLVLVKDVYMNNLFFGTTSVIIPFEYK